MRGQAVFVRVALAVALAAGAAMPLAAKTKPAANPKPPDLHGHAYIDQLSAPTDWMTNAPFWIGVDAVPLQVLDPARSDKIVIADPGNVASQVQGGSDSVEFVFQWGRGNSASQSQSGSGNSLETVQVSPGATTGKHANAGAGNGPEYDLFGYEVDPGNSGSHNRSPEAGDSAQVPNGGGNFARQDQSGTGDFGRVVQIGMGNQAVQAQQGAGDASVIVQLGDGNKAESDQVGAGNSSVIVQNGKDNIAVVRQ
jgi:hypothetical protein